MVLGVMVLSSSSVTVLVEPGWMVVVVKVVKVTIEVDFGARLTFLTSIGMTARANAPSELAKHPEIIGPGGLILLVTP